MKKEKAIRNILESKGVLRIESTLDDINIYYNEKKFEAFPVKIIILRVGDQKALRCVLGEKTIQNGVNINNTNFLLDFNKRHEMKALYIRTNNKDILIDEESDSNIEISIFLKNDKTLCCINVDYNLIKQKNTMEFIEVINENLCECMISNKIKSMFPKAYFEIEVGSDEIQEEER